MHLIFGRRYRSGIRFNMIISGNSILSGGNCKIEGSIVVLFVNLILMFGFVMAKKKRDKNL